MPREKVFPVIAVFLLLVAFSGLAVSASVQHHPFDQLFPPNQDLNFGGQNAENISELETARIVPNSSDIIFRDSGGVNTLVWDNSKTEWRIENSDLNLSGNNVETGYGTVSIRDSRNSQYVANFSEGGNVTIPNGDLELTTDAFTPLHLNRRGGDSTANVQMTLTSGDGGVSRLERSSGEVFWIKNKSGGILTEFRDGGTVEIPNGILDMDDNNIAQAGVITSEGVDVQETTSSHTSLSSGWYTIADNDGNRASAKFIVKDQEGGEHSATHFYAAHHYGTDNSNVINILSTSDYGSGCVRDLRIKEGGTSDGAMLQAYLDQDNCAGVQAMMLENFQNSGWDLRDWVSGDTIGGLSTTVKWNLDDSSSPDNAVRFSEGIQTKGNVNIRNNNITATEGGTETCIGDQC